MNYWTFFIVGGILFVTPCIVMAVSFGDTVKAKITGAMLCLAFWALLSGAMWGQSVSNAEKWNDGFCKCGAHWELKGATKTKMGSETKYYSCPKCYEEIEINH
jgi:hypothetical protein